MRIISNLLDSGLLDLSFVLEYEIDVGEVLNCFFFAILWLFYRHSPSFCLLSRQYQSLIDSTQSL